MGGYSREKAGLVQRITWDKRVDLSNVRRMEKERAVYLALALRERSAFQVHSTALEEVTITMRTISVHNNAAPRCCQCSYATYVSRRHRKNFKPTTPTPCRCISSECGRLMEMPNCTDEGGSKSSGVWRFTSADM